MSRIVGLNDLKKKNESKEDKKQEQLFAGGLDQRGGGSGVNVLGPPSNDDDDGDDEDGMFGKIARGARQSGAVLDGSSGSSNVSRRITMYANGFTIDNGPLRDFHLPENQQFMRELSQGRLPSELGNISVADVELVNKATEDYTPPAYIPFSNGNSLGSAELSSDTFVLDPDMVSTLADSPDPVDESKPTTTVQVRTLTGQRLKIRINQDATILQLATCIKCQYTTSDTYVLSAGHPSKDLESPSMTILEANLLNSLVTMRKV